MISRENRYKKGRSCTKYYYTTKDIARITGRAIGTIRNDMVSEKLVMPNLLSVVNYISKHIEEKHDRQHTSR